MARELAVSKDENDDVLVFTLEGPVDALTMEVLDSVLGPVFRSRNARAVVDCNNMTYICSSGIALFIEYHRQCCLGSGKIVVCCSNKSVLKAFQRLKVDAIVTIVPDKEQALATVKA